MVRLVTVAGTRGSRGLDRGDRPVGAVAHVVERRDVAALGLGQPQQQLAPAARPARCLPGPHHVGDVADHLLAVADRRDVDERGHRLRVERGVPAGDDHRVRLGAVGGVQRNPGQVQRGEQVGVAELGGEADPDQVERAQRPVPVHGEGGHPVLAHQRLEVGPHRVGALGQGVGALVEHLVEDHDALVGQAHLVGVRVHQRPPDVHRVPGLELRVQLATDVLHGLGDARQQRLEGSEHISGHVDPG